LPFVALVPLTFFTFLCCHGIVEALPDTEKIRKEVMSATQREVERVCGEGGKKIIRELALIAFANMADFVDVKEGVVYAKSLKDLKRGRSRIIRKIKEKRTFRRDPQNAKNQVIESTFEFELHPKIEALRELDLLGGYRAAEKRELTGPDGGPIDVALRKAAAQDLLNEVDGATRGVPGRREQPAQG
jgi:hypothetical protein